MQAQTTNGDTLHNPLQPWEQQQLQCYLPPSTHTHNALNRVLTFFGQGPPVVAFPERAPVPHTNGPNPPWSRSVTGEPACF